MGEQSEDDFELDYDPSGAPDVLERLQFVSGTKEDFASMVQASYESDHWVRKFRDYDCYRKMFGDEKIHYIVAKTKYSEFVGTCICFEMEKMCFVGIYYVIPKYRSKGVGKKLFSETVTDALKQQYNIGLHAVKAMSTIYEKELGFDKKANWLVDTVQISDINFEKLNDLKTSKTVKGVRDVEFEKLVQYDVSVNKTKRESYVRHWAFERNDSVCKVVVDGKDCVNGYGCARLLSVIGSPALCPIYADDDDTFKSLLKALILCYEEELKSNNSIHIRSPSTKTQCVKQLLSGIAQVEVTSQCVPQFTKCVPEHDIDKIYSITDMTMFI